MTRLLALLALAPCLLRSRLAASASSVLVAGQKCVTAPSLGSPPPSETGRYQHLETKRDPEVLFDLFFSQVSEMAVSELPGNPNAVWTVRRHVEGKGFLIEAPEVCSAG